MAITAKEKELVAVGISVASGCRPCTNYHVKKAHEADVSDEDIKQAMNDALSLRKRAADSMQEFALSSLGQKKISESVDSNKGTNRIKEMVLVGAAFGVNCVPSLKKHLAAAESLGCSQDEINEIVNLAVFIKKKAASHVERLFDLEEVQ